MRSFTATHPVLGLLSRDEHSGQTAWKQPVSWFETHTDVLHHLSTYAHGDGRPDTTLSGSAPHPFWVEQDQAFVLLGDLKSGDLLHRAGGSPAVVLDHSRE
ncbi:MAG: hypothetical protein WBE58_25230 [Verrucomicrobiales bacterium]|nr:hypothetical protein [Verrucomicrobiales bacterium]